MTMQVILLCLAFSYSKSQTFLLIRKEMSLYWASGHTQIQTLGDVRFILPRFWWSRNTYLTPQSAKEDKPFFHCCFKKSDNNENRQKEFERLYAAKTVCLNHTKRELGSTKLFY
jgi:hypothetical protein